LAKDFSKKARGLALSALTSWDPLPRVAHELITAQTPMAQAVCKAMGGVSHWWTKVMDDLADFRGMDWAFITRESHRWEIVIGLKNPKKTHECDRSTQGQTAIGLGVDEKVTCKPRKKLPFLTQSNMGIFPQVECFV
jgi:hypothetical protein